MSNSGNPILERRRKNAIVSSDPARLDLEVIYGFLSRAYWSEGIPRDVLERAVRNSLCFGVYVDGAQVGFARVITDCATFAYLADVFILESHRGHGLSKLLMETIISHPDLQGLRRFSLATRDAHGLYCQFGFQPPKMPERLMEILDPDVYRTPRAAEVKDRKTAGVKGEAADAKLSGPKKILFVCIGNACRSPMAEAFANHLGEGRVRAWSAGLFPIGWIPPETHTVMEERGLSLDGQSSKGLEEVPLAAMDLVVDMAGDNLSVPVPAGFKGRVIQWDIPDAFSSDLEANRETRDLIEAHVRALLAELEGIADTGKNERESTRRMGPARAAPAGAEVKSHVEASNSSSASKVLFLCVGNSCRSQMAEAFLNHLGQGQVRAWSAGSAPLGWITAETYIVMQEKGLALNGHCSKGLGEVPVAEVDVVVGMGCEVVCPVPAGFKGRIVEWNIPDPFLGDLDRYRGVRNLIESHVAALLSEIQKADSM